MSSSPYEIPSSPYYTDSQFSGNSSPNSSFSSLPFVGSYGSHSHTSTPTTGNLFPPTTGNLFSNNPTLPVHTGGFVIEQLEIHDLLRNRHVLELYNRANNASTIILETTQHNNRLLQEISDLKANMVSNEKSTKAISERPDNFPVSVLWSESDCRRDPKLKMTASNPNRIPMHAAIRNEDGTPIDSCAFDGIRASGILIIHKILFVLPPAPNSQAEEGTHGRTYFKTWFYKAYLEAVEEFERQQPLLALCSANWKADHMLGYLLNSLNQSQKHREGGSKSKAKENVNPDQARRHPTPSELSSAPSSSAPSFVLSPAIPGSLKRPSQSQAGKEDSHTLKKTKSSVSMQPPRMPLASPTIVTTLNDLTDSSGLDKAYMDPKKIMVDFIIVRPTFQNLRNIFEQDYQNVAIAKDLLTAMEGCPDFHRQDPSSTMMEFLMRIETADPKDTSFDEDNSGPGWGHYQFTSGSLTCASVVTSWAEVGNTDIACRLIAASVRTAKVARYICEEKRITATSFIADMYVERVVESLWTAWKSTPGACTITTSNSLTPTRSPSDTAPSGIAPSPKPTSITSTLNSDNTPSADQSEKQGVVVPVDDVALVGEGLEAGVAVGTEQLPVQKTPVVKSTEDILKLFQNKELKAWALSHNVRLEGPPNKQRTNKDLISSIMNDTNAIKPSEDDLATILAARAPRKRKSVQTTQQ